MMLRLANAKRKSRVQVELGGVDSDRGWVAVNVGLLSKIARRSPSVEDTIAAMRGLAVALRDPSKAGAIAAEIAEAVEAVAGELDEQLRPSRPKVASVQRRRA